MPDITEVADQIAGAGSWDERVSLIRTIPQEFGEAHRQTVYDRVAQRAYVKQLAPDFAYIHRRDDYELASVGDAYQLANASTSGFTEVGPAQMCHVMEHHGTTLRAFRLIVGFFDAQDVPRAMLEAKAANDGGTARDKAARFRMLRTEAQRLGGMPVFALLAGLGWTRTADALGPVVAACDGRVHHREPRRGGHLPAAAAAQRIAA
ncbi:MAG: hypothetical protein H0V93_11410 [Euzebyales bacterium]|jgi:hypothetical protein|nr:hypothetical protein [Euzebyales bacterium]